MQRERESERERTQKSEKDTDRHATREKRGKREEDVTDTKTDPCEDACPKTQRGFCDGEATCAAKVLDEGPFTKEQLPPKCLALP